MLEYQSPGFRRPMPSCKVLKGVEIWVRPKLCLQGAYNISTLYVVNGAIPYMEKALLLLFNNETFKAFGNLKFRKLKISFCLSEF